MKFPRIPLPRQTGGAHKVAVAAPEGVELCDRCGAVAVYAHAGWLACSEHVDSVRETADFEERHSQ
jgi:hypothetical protein